MNIGLCLSLQQFVSLGNLLETEQLQEPVALGFGTNDLVHFSEVARVRQADL